MMQLLLDAAAGTISPPLRTVPAGRNTFDLQIECNGTQAADTILVFASPTDTAALDDYVLVATITLAALATPSGGTKPAGFLTASSLSAEGPFEYIKVKAGAGNSGTVSAFAVTSC